MRRTPLIFQLAGFILLEVFSGLSGQSALLPSAWTAEAPGAPGVAHYWAAAQKQALGTAYEPQGAKSPIWFTVSQGILGEIFYPFVDHPQTSDFQFVISDGKGFFWEQKRDAISSVQYSGDGMSVRIQGRDKGGKFKFEQWIVTDPDRPVLRVRTRIEGLPAGYKAYLLLKPAIGNSGHKDHGIAHPSVLYAWNEEYYRNEPVALALVAAPGFTETSTGYFGASDGWQQLSRNFKLVETYDTAGPGSIVLTGGLPAAQKGLYEFDTALGFGRDTELAEKSARQSLAIDFDGVRTRYESGWKSYLGGLAGVKKIKMMQEQFYRRSVVTVKMHEDKRNRGAMIAAFAKPGIPAADVSQENIGGYHLVWPRDLYHSSLGLLAAGDQKTPIDTLKYLASRQREDGAWWQNFWLDGTPYWKMIQMDQVSFPILLAYQLNRRGLIKIEGEIYTMVRKAGDFLFKYGPMTEQDRWEEIGGYIPSTIAAQIAALRVAAKLVNNPAYAQKAAEWDRDLESWIRVEHGPLGSDYYLRASPGGNPNTQEPILIANEGGPAFSNEIIDGGFLELVRMGIRRADHPTILSTLDLYESPKMDLAIELSGGKLFRRYNRDRYGHARTGGFWPLLAGERGEYALLAGDRAGAEAQLNAMERSALPSGMLPEQVREDGTAGLGVPSPLSWAHAEVIRLRRSIDDGVIFDWPLP